MVTAIVVSLMVWDGGPGVHLGLVPKMEDRGE